MFKIQNYSLEISTRVKINDSCQFEKRISKAFTFLVIFSEPIGIVIDFCPIVERF